MAIQIASQPNRWSSAYRPTEFVFESDGYPNTTAGDVGIPVVSIQLTSLGIEAQLSQQFATSDLQAGELINITQTDNGLYEGNFRVKSAFISGAVLVVYLDTEYVGDETGGKASRVYDNFRIVAEVFFDGSGNTVEFELKPDENDQFILNVQDCAARQFTRIFDVVEPGLSFGVVRDCGTTIAQGYSVTAWERWTLWTDGVPSVFDNRKGIEVKLVNFRTVNCIHPYHKSSPFSMDWSDDIGTLLPMGNGTGARKLLSWGSRSTQIVQEDEDFFISFLVNTPSETLWELFVTYYNSAGSGIGVQYQTDITPPIYAGTMNVGPNALTVPAGTSYYTVVMRRSGSAIMETLTLQYQCKTAEVSKRIYWRNKLGGIDQYTMMGREMEIPSVGRSSIYRTHNPIPGTGYIGGWNERSYRADPIRSKVLTGELEIVSNLTWLTEDCFESSDHATEIRSGWWTPMVIDSTQSTPFGTDNQNARFLIEYHYGVDNSSQRG